MGHPLIGASVCFDRFDSRFVLVNGSNMSGKSTLLARGAPVCCHSLQISSFSLATSLRVQDSLKDGKSRFLAEVDRVRQIVDQSERGPVLFLLDELLSGTNSEDRRAGCRRVGCPFAEFRCFRVSYDARLSSRRTCVLPARHRKECVLCRPPFRRPTGI